MPSNSHLNEKVQTVVKSVSSPAVSTAVKENILSNLGYDTKMYKIENNQIMLKKQPEAPMPNSSVRGKVAVGGSTPAIVSALAQNKR